MAKKKDYIGEEQSRQDYSSYVVKLLWRVIGKIKPEDLSFKDKDALEDILTFQSVSDIARRKHVSETKVRQQIHNGLETVSKQIDSWIRAMKENVRLKEENKELKSTITDMQRTIDRMERELDKSEQQEDSTSEPETEPVPETPRYSPYAKPVNDDLNKKLTKQLSSLAIPKDIITTLQRQGIFTVFDLVSMSESEYEDLYGLSRSGEVSMKKCISDLGLQINMPVYWDNKRGKYMM